MRFYRLLLRLFPASFRAEYAEEMCAVFAARRRVEKGVVLWISTILDMLTNAARIQADVLCQDLRWALRSLLKSPRFALTAISVMALGIGATTAAFTLLDHVFLRRLPFPNPGRLVMLYQTDLTHDVPRQAVSPPDFTDWVRMSASFSSLGAYNTGTAKLTGRGKPRLLKLATFTSGVFRALGVQPAVGRTFGAEDDRLDAADVIVLSHRFAEATFGDAIAALGRTLKLDGRVSTVVGVMPPGFAFPSPDVDVWTPYRFTAEELSDRENNKLMVIARLRESVSITQARAEMNLIATRLERAHPKGNRGMGATVVPMRDALTSPKSRTLVLMVFAAAVCLILIACSNLATLLFVRTLARRHETAVRIAMGAGRERVVRQLLTESLLLAICGGLLGIVLAMTATPLLTRLVPQYLPVGPLPAMDPRIFVFAAMLTLATSITFGAGPAVRSYRHADVNALRSRSATSGESSRLRAALVAVQVCATMILLVCSGLLMQALWRVEAVDPGFRPEGVLTLRTALEPSKYSDVAARGLFYANVLERVRALPGVKAAGYISGLPLVMVAGISAASSPTGQNTAQVSRRFVTSGYFAAMGIPLLRGRGVTERDGAAAPLAAVISQSLADQLWPGQDPIGKRVDVDRVRRGWTVVGVAGNVTTRGLERSSEPQMYFPFGQELRNLPFYWPKDLVIRASGDPATLVPAVRQIIRETDPEQLVTDVRLLGDVLTSQTAMRRTQLGVLGIFAVLAFSLAGVGVYALLSYSVSTRNKEVGVRLALGAQRGNVLAMFLRQALILGAVGIGAAVPLAYVAARAMSSLLFGIEPAEPAIYFAAALLALAMTFAGSLGPALRAARTEPAITIRND